MQKCQLQRFIYSSASSYQLMTAKHKHTQLLLQLLSRHQPKTGPKTSRKLNFPAVGGARCAQSSIIGGAMSKKARIQNSEVDFIVNILTCVALKKKGGEYLWSFFKAVLAEMEQRGNSRSVWRDSSSSAHPRHSRQGPSGAASSQSRSVCTNTRNTTKAAAHPCKQWAGQSQEPEGGLALRGSSERSQVLHNKSFIAVGTRDEGMSGCVGASGLFVKHNNAAKVRL